MSPNKDLPSRDAAAKARLFFALWPPPAAARALVAMASEAARSHGGRVTRPETVHLTLAFLGEVPLSALAGIEGAARNVRVPPFSLILDRLEVWQRQHLLVARCDCPPPLAALVAGLRASLASAGRLAAQADYPFKPHVTLVRKIPPPAVIEMPAAATPTPPGSGPLDALPELPPQVWRCDRFVLARSRLSPSGPGYEVVAEFPLTV